MTKCGAFTAKGHSCKGLVRAGSDYCPAHEPARADARRRSASKAARNLPGREEDLAAGVDFTQAMDCSDSVGGRPYGAPGPGTPRKKP